MKLKTNNKASFIESELQFKGIFDKHFSGLVRFANRYVLNRTLAEDIVQGIFIELWEKRATIFLIDNSPQVYLFTAVKNRCLNEIRNQHVKDANTLRYSWAILVARDNNHEPMINEDKLINAIKQLPPIVRQTINLRYFEEKSIHEISSILSVSKNTVKTNLKRAKSKLRFHLGKRRNG
ncbi:MAG: sigma-70 family RNA polymerase sigma factor [Cyclobacteriaceae bacterium]|nr:sigma-70 family RNA polymerase sigma factor [Cyclobacteriaceae bacterium]